MNCAPQNSHVGTLTPNVVAFGDGPLGGKWGSLQETPELASCLSLSRPGADAVKRWMPAARKSPHRETELAGTLTLDFQPPELGQIPAVEVTQSVTFCCDSLSWLMCASQKA